MGGRFRILIILVVAAFYATACTFSTKLPTPTPPAEAPAEEVQRPQTTFIDARNLPDESAPTDAESAVAAESQNGSGGASGNSTTTNTSYSAPASGGVSGGASSGASSASGGGYYPPGGNQGGYWSCSIRYDWAYTYIVQRGDTLSNIAARAWTTWQALAQGNCISNPNYIYAGQVLRVPNPVSYYPPPHPYPPYPYPPYPYPTPVPPTPAPPPPVVIGSGLSFAPYDEINNNTVILPPDTMITISWPGTFPTATDRVTFELIPPGDSVGQPIGIDTNLGDGATITWFAVAYTQGTVRAVATFAGGYPPQYSDSYYIIAGFPP